MAHQAMAKLSARGRDGADEDWAHSTFGRKIQQAIDFNAKGRKIAILAEDAWANALCNL